MAQIIEGRTVLSGPADSGAFAPADVLIQDGSISRIEPSLDLAGAEVIGATGSYVLPGRSMDAHRPDDLMAQVVEGAAGYLPDCVTA